MNLVPVRDTTILISSSLLEIRSHWDEKLYQNKVNLVSLQTILILMVYGTNDGTRRQGKDISAELNILINKNSRFFRTGLNKMPLIRSGTMSVDYSEVRPNN